MDVVTSMKDTANGALPLPQCSPVGGGGGGFGVGFGIGFGGESSTALPLYAAVGSSAVSPSSSAGHTSVSSTAAATMTALPGTTDEVPAAARTLVLLSNDACRHRRAASEKRTSRPYKFVPKREDDRILIEAFRHAVATARDRGLTNEHISAQIGESGMSANLISKVVHGHRGLGRFRPAVAAWSENFCGKSLQDLYAEGELDVARSQMEQVEVSGIAAMPMPTTTMASPISMDDDEMDVVMAGMEPEAEPEPARVLHDDAVAQMRDAGDMVVASSTCGGGGGGYPNPNPSVSPSLSPPTSPSYKSEPRSDDDRRLLEDFKLAVAAARKRGWTNEKIAKEIGALNANVVSKLVHGHQGLGRYKDTVTQWTQHVFRLIRSGH